MHVRINTIHCLAAALAMTAASAQAAPFAYFSTYSGTVYVLDIATNTVVRSLPAGGGFAYATAVTPDGTRAYVPSYFAGDITVIDTATNTTSTISGVPATLGIAFNPAGTLAYATNFGGYNTVSVLDTNPADAAYNTVVATIPIAGTNPNPNGVAVSPDGNRVYVANHDGNSVSVIDTNPADAGTYNTVIATIDVGANPVGLAVSPDGSKVYVGNSGSNGPGVVSVIAVDVSGTPSPTADSINVGDAPTAVAIDPAGRCVYVSNQNSASVAVIDVVSGSVAGTIPVGSGPVGIALTHDGRYAYVANRGDGTASQIDTATARVVATVTLDSTTPGNADVAAVGKFITPENTDSVFANDFGICGF
ncbi:MAG TPA: YncE family protein [Rudaea sp.]|nr:YncE family protein [Rudaea sp.]